MRYFLYYENGDSAPTLISEENILDNLKFNKRLKGLSKNVILDYWMVNNYAWEIEYKGEGPLDPRWVDGTRKCPYYVDCAFSKHCPRKATPDVIKEGTELFENRPNCHSKLKLDEHNNV
jgi:hypothetical protein